MKRSIFIIVYCIGLSGFSQAGIYERYPKLNNGAVIKWTLHLNPDGTFFYHFLRDLSAVSKVNQEENMVCKGTWIVEGKQVIFDSEETEVIVEHKTGQTSHIFNFKGTKARYITKSPRDASDRIVKTALLFYESKMSTIKGLKLFKIK